MIKTTIDVGGTFTDCLVLDEQGQVHAFKSPTTPQDPTLGLTNVLTKAAAFFGLELPQFMSNVGLLIAHGTTLSTNALLTGRIAKVGLMATKGFRDTIEIRRGYKNLRTSRFNVFVPPYKPLVPRYLRLPVEERTIHTGEILKPLKEEDVYAAIKKLKEDKVEAVAICFLHSYINPAHEKRALEICRQELNGTYVTASHEVLPVYREYERFSTTVVSAAVGPITANYLKALTNRLRELGFKGTLYLVQGGGLVQSVEESARRAVSLIGSGPAAAPAGAIRLGQCIHSNNLFSVDMGGTSYDVCLIRDGMIPTTDYNWVGDERVAMKMVDVPSVGAGGGSIAWINSLRLLQVGPQSAGADPGPACYGKGGTQPTVTDADLMLGYVPADYFLGGEIPLKPDLAEQAIRTVGEPLGLDVPSAARTIFTTVNSVMADKMTEISTKRGYDVRDFALVVGGGAGPVHGAHLAELLEIPTVIIPRYAATYSAFGMLNMEVGRDFARSIISRKSLLELERVNRLFAEMEVEARQVLGEIGISPQDTVLRRSLEMRYLGQFHEVEVTEVPIGKIGSRELEEIVQAFHRRHQDLFTFHMPGREVEFLNARLKATARQDPLKLAEIPQATVKADQALKRRRPVLWNLTKGYEDTPIYDGSKLRAGHTLEGPAIVEEKTTTVVIPSSYRCCVDGVKNYILTRR
ncbi:MAG: hydantoinase/oxoprolinase family protein [Candidatus Tectomicrobia bacterium]|uniref:Hydantoinase/oxoprolinase family protein n=1 Tax=Tectimicrobiota bacterium TaxID=2528274 RepID=A0A932GMN2_UNCTE|nr:hydantoinase/oxoprolinase family protein [Candidatus Tectomicrobia bacterium]